MTEEQAKAIIENTKRMGDLLELILNELRQNKPAKIGVIEGSTGKPVLTVDDEPLRG